MQTIPTVARNLCPEFNEEFQNIENIIQELRNRIKQQVKPEHPSLYPRLLWKFEIFTQLAIYRCVDLAESILLDWEHLRIGSSFIVLRSLFETTALMFDSANQIEEHCEQNDFKALNKLVDRLNFSTRIEDFQPFKAVNILSVIDRINKIIPVYRYHYDQLCEYSHPNHFAFMGLYGNLRNKFICDLSFHTMADKNGVQINFSLLSVTLSTAFIAIQKIENNVPQIASIATGGET